ncbi:hypothetical protein [uncultured Aquimarina sp.]|uniref:hypothetical protein n=1 Tax=uncultured Aquimarina sp. TaxID=575652 RepID=UPI002615200B|nr:hypothetical protein [uncultured Aquimarina sp.]
MRIHSIDLLHEQIKNSKSKEYFEEVIRSYYSKNFRSAIVMLYSIVICDLVFKLQELKDQFNDESAKSILSEIEELQKRNPTSSQWENKLVELIKEKTNIFEHSDYENILHLQKHRHLCAHPVMLQDYKLYSPNQETVRAHIINILEGLLTKPALLSKKIFNEFLTNLSEIKDILITEKDIETHLKSKYLENLNPAIEKEIFRSLWKIVFKSDNIQCDENREINFKALNIILKRNYDELIQFVKDDNQYFSNNLNLDFFDLILRFLNNNPRIIDNLNESSKTLIKSKINQDENYVFLAWFLNETLSKHLTYLKGKNNDDFNVLIKTETIIKLFNIYKGQGLLNQSKEIVIMMYGKSRNYDQADSRFDNLIQPLLSEFTILELTELIKEINNNGQVHGRRYAKWSNRLIKEKVDELNPDYDYSSFMFFET